MALSITKTKTKKVVEDDHSKLVVESAFDAETLAAEPLESLVDKLGDLEDRIQALTPRGLIQQADLVRSTLLGRVAEAAEADESVTITGKSWMAEISACAKEPRKVVDKAKMASFIGMETFITIANIKVTDATKYLTPDQFDQVVSVAGYSTNRKLSLKFFGK